MSGIEVKNFQGFQKGWVTNQNPFNQTPESLRFANNVRWKDNGSIVKREGSSTVLDNPINNPEEITNLFSFQSINGKRELIIQNGTQIYRKPENSGTTEKIGEVNGNLKLDSAFFRGKLILSNEITQPKKYWYLENPLKPVLDTQTDNTISLGPRTYFVKISYNGTNGETKASNSNAVQVGGSEKLVVKAPPDQKGAESYNVYASEVSGDEVLQDENIDLNDDWVEPDTGLQDDTTLPDPPTENNAWVFKEVDDLNAPQGSIIHTHNSRLFIAGVQGSKMTMFYSALENEDSWPDPQDPSSTGDPAEPGVWDFQNIVGHGDRIQAIESLQDRLIVIFESHIVMLQFPEDATQAAVVQEMQEYGAVDRDTVLPVGNDVFWLSKRGVVSVRQAFAQENLLFDKEMPSFPINETLENFVDRMERQNTQQWAQAVYVPRKNLAVWILPEFGSEDDVSQVRMFAFDVEKGNWSFFSGIKARCAEVTEEGTWYIGLSDQVIEMFDGSFDDQGDPIKMAISTPWLHLDNPAINKKGKFVKFPITSEKVTDIKLRFDWDFGMNRIDYEELNLPVQSEGDDVLSDVQLDETAYLTDVRDVQRVPIRGRGQSIKLAIEEESDSKVEFSWFNIEFVPQGRKLNVE